MFPASAMAHQGETRLLLIEDDADIRESLRADLEELGFTVETAVDGADGLRRLENACLPNLILLDLLMPVMDGWQFLRAWSELGGLEKVPVVAVSAVAYRGAPGAVTTIAKPIRFTHLVEVIERFRAQDDSQRPAVASGT